MNLHERVEYVVAKYAGSRTKISKILGIQQRTFDGYFSVERQNNLWQYLSKILEAYPFISRDWLYFGEGESIKRESDGQTVRQKEGDADWKERYYEESEAHKRTLLELNQVRKELNQVRKELAEARQIPTASGMDTAISISLED